MWYLGPCDRKTGGLSNGEQHVQTIVRGWMGAPANGGGQSPAVGSRVCRNKKLGMYETRKRDIKNTEQPLWHVFKPIKKVGMPHVQKGDVT